MEKIAVVIGAGASAGCVEGVGYNGQPIARTDHRLVPPLTNELFDVRRDIFCDLLKHFRGAEQLSGRIRTMVTQGESLETILRKLSEDSDKYTKDRLDEVPLYLRAVLKTVSEGFIINGPTHYFWLVDEIRPCAARTLCALAHR